MADISELRLVALWPRRVWQVRFMSVDSRAFGFLLMLTGLHIGRRHWSQTNHSAAVSLVVPPLVASPCSPESDRQLQHGSQREVLPLRFLWTAHEAQQNNNACMTELGAATKTDGAGKFFC